MDAPVIVLGTGPAGLTAALYLGRANLRPLVIEGPQPGGVLTTTTLVENYPGFPNGIPGPELVEAMHLQAQHFGATILPGQATGVDLSRRPFQVRVNDESHSCQALIIATGASPNLLGLESERRLFGRGVSTCATCDGYFFRDKEVAVIGGGDSAMEESLFLAKLVRSVHIVHRRDQLRASKIMQQRVFANDKVRIIWSSIVTEILGDPASGVSGVRLRQLRDDTESILPCHGVFLAIGHTPNTAIFSGQLEIDQRGYLVTHDGPATSIPGVFAAGDVQDHVYRQAVTAAGSGCMAAMAAERFLEGISH